MWAYHSYIHDAVRDNKTWDVICREVLTAKGNTFLDGPANYFRTALAAAFLDGALDDTIVISPRFASNDGSCHDKLASNEVSWSCSGDSWRSGGTAVSDTRLSSDDFDDEIPRKLARKEHFPNVKPTCGAGPAAGGRACRFAWKATERELSPAGLKKCARGSPERFNRSSSFEVDGGVATRSMDSKATPLADSHFSAFRQVLHFGYCQTVVFALMKPPAAWACRIRWADR